MGTQYTHDAFTGHSVITINASHLKEKKIKKSKPLPIPSTTQISRLINFEIYFRYYLPRASVFCLMLVVKCGRKLLINFSSKDDGRLERTFERTLSNEFSRTPTYVVGKQTTFTCRLKKAVTSRLKEQCHFHLSG